MEKMCMLGEEGHEVMVDVDRRCRWCKFLACEQCMPEFVCRHCQNYNEDYRIMRGDDLV